MPGRCWSGRAAQELYRLAKLIAAVRKLRTEAKERTVVGAQNVPEPINSSWVALNVGGSRNRTNSY